MEQSTRDRATAIVHEKIGKIRQRKHDTDAVEVLWMKTNRPDKEEIREHYISHERNLIMAMTKAAELGWCTTWQWDNFERDLKDGKFVKLGIWSDVVLVRPTFPTPTVVTRHWPACM